MTIGIAASGLRAGLAIYKSLEAVEAIGHGAIGGFVSFAALSGGRVWRAETQQGGIRASFPDGLPRWLTESTCAVLMSSGPNRPAPLAQFTPGNPEIGLLTGHRFPNAMGSSGVPLNRAVLSAMEKGSSPQLAIETILAAHPQADAGLIAVTQDGRIGIGDSPYLDQFDDRGQAVLTSEHGTIAVAHNAIAPFRSLALMTAEVGMEVLASSSQEDVALPIAAGTPLTLGNLNAVQVNSNGKVIRLVVSNPLLLLGEHSFGLGYKAPVLGFASPMRLHYEPYMVVENGVLQSIDGNTNSILILQRSR